MIFLKTDDDMKNTFPDNMPTCSALTCERNGKKRFKSICESCEQKMYACSTLHHTMLSHLCLNCKDNEESPQEMKEGGGTFSKIDKI